MLSLESSEIYITHVCNLNCPDCITYNNFDFRGHQRWRDYQDVYKAWSKKLLIKRIGIVGGEPFAHPDLPDWVDGILNLWPTSRIEILSNGTQLNRYPEIYQRLEEHHDRLALIISAHGVVQKQKICEQLTTWLPGKVFVKNLADDNELQTWKHSYINIKDPSWPDCDGPEDFIRLPKEIQMECREIFGLDFETWVKNLHYTQLSNEQGVTVHVRRKNQFVDNAIIYDPVSNRARLRHTLPENAYKSCCARSKDPVIFTHQFNRGKLFKCSTTGLLPDLIKQVDIDINDAERELILNYQPCTVDASDADFEKFILDLKQDQSIKSCQFCQDSMKLNPAFKAGPKKIKLHRIKNHECG